MYKRLNNSINSFFRIAIVISAVLLFALFPLTNVKASTINLINNPSVETASLDPNIPNGWNKGGWGTNTPVYSYENSGYDGTKSLKVSISSYTNGDAKWFFDPVNVQPGQTYVYSDYYKSDVNSDIVAEVTSSTNTISYVYIGTTTPSSTWRQFLGSFTAPANASKLSVFHFIYSVGTLQTDNFILKTPDTAQISNGVPNASFESVNDLNPSLPLGWNKGSWGTNNTSFSYLNTGHTGTRSAKVEITSYTSGDSKWIFDPQSVKGNTDYQISDYYISNVASDLVAEVTKSDKTIQYIGIVHLSPSNDWTQAKGVFTTPVNAVKVTVYHLISSVGYLITDDYSFLPYIREGFNRAIISVNFDDGWRDVYKNGLPILNKYGIKTTQFIISDYIGAPQYMTNAQINTFKNGGHEIGSHTIDHQDLTTLSQADIENELSQSKQKLESLYGPIYDFASPYGTYNDTSINLAKKYYQSYRTTDDGYMYKTDFDQYHIKTKNIVNTTTVAEVQNWINEAAKNKTWLIIVYHQVNGSGSEYSTTLNKLDREMLAIKNSGLKVSTMHEALNELLPQLN